MSLEKEYVGFLKMHVIQQMIKRKIVATIRQICSFSETEENPGSVTNKSVINTIVPMSDPHRVINVHNNISQYPNFPK